MCKYRESEEQKWEKLVRSGVCEKGDEGKVCINV